MYVQDSTLFPLVTRSSAPPSPNNVSVRWQGTSLLITWFPPPPRSSLVTIGCYLVEYRTLGQWVPLAERVAASERPSYRWTTASRSATYQFRVFSVGVPCRPDVLPRRSQPSAIVTFHTSGIFHHYCYRVSFKFATHSGRLSPNNQGAIHSSFPPTPAPVSFPALTVAL